MALHQSQVQQGLLPGDGVTGDRVAVVAVYPPELDGHPVKKHHPVLYLDLPQAHHLYDALVGALQHQGVLGGVLGVPQHRGLHLEGHIIPLGLGGGHQLPVGGVQAGGEGGFALQLQLYGDLGAGEVRGEALFHKEVPQVFLGPGQKVHVPKMPLMRSLSWSSK